jgi:hypothetical protein
MQQPQYWQCHPREGGDLSNLELHLWMEIAAFAGMTLPSIGRDLIRMNSAFNAPGVN